MIEIIERSDGIVLPVRAAAGSRENAVRGEIGGALQVAVTQQAEKRKANKAIIALLAQFFELPKSQIELIAGATHSHKKFLLREAELQKIAAKLATRKICRK